MTAAPTRMTRRPSTWPSSAADRSASACCSSSCCRCPPAAAGRSACGCTNRRSAPAGRRLPGRPAQQPAQYPGRQYVGAGRRAPGLRGLAAAPESRLAGRPRGGRRDRSGRFPAPTAVRRLHGRRLRAGARAGAKPGRDAGTRARARRRRHAAGQWTRAGVGGIGAALCGAPRGVVQRQPALARLPGAGSRAWLLQQPLSGQRAGGRHRRRRHGLRDRHQPERGRRRGRAAAGRASRSAHLRVAQWPTALGAQSA